MFDRNIRSHKVDERDGFINNLQMKKKMEKKKAFISFLYLVSIVFLPWWISLSFQKSLESWVTNWWNTKQSETFLNAIQEKNLIEKFIELEEWFIYLSPSPSPSL